MPKLTTKVPKYRRHRASGQAVVTLNGQDIYLGRWNVPESKAEYQRLVGQWQTNGRQVAERIAKNPLCIDQIILAYLEHAGAYYVKNGQPTSSIYSVRSAMRLLHEHYGETDATGFGPLALKHVRDHMTGHGWSLRTVNKQVGIIKNMFKWASSNELIPATVYHALRTVDGLRRGRSEARETATIMPVSEDHIQAVLPYLSRLRSTTESDRFSSLIWDPFACAFS